MLINSDIVGNTITLDKNYTAGSGDTSLTIPADKKLTLDLNGYTLDRNLSSAADDGRVIVNNGILTIKDSSAAQTGTVTGAYYDGDGGAILNNKTRTLNIEGGSFTGNIGNHGGVVYNMGTLNMTGGSMYGNTANGNGGAIWNGRQGVLNLSGGVITDNTYGEGGAVYSRENGTLNIFGSPIVTENGDRNIYLRQAVINVTGELSSNAKLAVTREDVTDGFVFTSGLSGNGSAGNFFSDNDAYSVRTNVDGEAVFKKNYTIIVEKPENGVLTAENAASGILTSCEGNEITLTLTPDEGYGIKSVMVDGDELLPGNDSYLFTAPAHDVTVSAEFERTKWFAGYSLTLRGDIGINYYIYLTEEELEKGATVDFSWNVDGTEKTHSVTITSADSSGIYYIATVYLPVAEMSYDVTATLTIGGSETHTNSYSVKQYAEYILTDEYKAIYLNDGHSEEEYRKLERLVKTMLDYGAKAQMEFDRNLDVLANEDIDYSMSKVTASDVLKKIGSAPDMTADLSEYGLEYVGSSVVYLSKTSLRHYYRIVDETKFDAVKDSVTFNDEKVGFTDKNVMICFELPDISADHFDERYTLRVGTSDYNYSVLDYVYVCLNSKNAPYLTRQLVSATYWYYQAAEAYVGN